MCISKMGTRIGKLRGNDAQAMVEFAIVFPVVFLLFLTLCQTAMLYTAKQVVQYAAFSAARSAVVWIPESEDVDGTTSLGDEFELDVSPTAAAGPKAKFEKIEGAAAKACMAIAPPVDITSYGDFVVGFVSLYNAIVSELGLGSVNYFQEAGMTMGTVLDPLSDPITAYNLLTDPAGTLQEIVPDLVIHCYTQTRRLGSVASLKTNAKILLITTALGQLSTFRSQGTFFLAKKYIYSRFFTAVRFYEPGTEDEFDSPHTFEAGDDITVEATHYYSMKIPIINKLIFTVYMSLYMPNRYREELEDQGLSEETISRMLHQLHEKVNKIASESSLSFYPIPIRARSTLTIEGDRDWS